MVLKIGLSTKLFNILTSFRVQYYWFLTNNLRNSTEWTNFWSGAKCNLPRHPLNERLIGAAKKFDALRGKWRCCWPNKIRSMFGWVLTVYSCNWQHKSPNFLHVPKTCRQRVKCSQTSRDFFHWVYWEWVSKQLIIP